VRDAGAVDDCPNCVANAAFRRGEDPWGVARLSTGTVRLGRNQYHRGLTFFVAERCVAELHELPRDERDAHLAEMADVAAAVWRAFGPRKLNYEALGNSVPHLHWWLTPRYEDDPVRNGPIWVDPDFLRVESSGEPSPDEAERESLRDALRGALLAEGAPVEQWYR
jgi:diadenosine tetraphosphate (Ap4A) HIT family hydrolase